MYWVAFVSMKERIACGDPASDTYYLIKFPAKYMLGGVIKVYKDDRKAAQFQDNKVM